MDFSQAAKQLNIESYPPELDRINADVKAGRITSPFGRDLIERLQEKYQLFHERYPEVLAGCDEVLRDEARCVWVKTVSLYAKECTRGDLRKLFLPKTDGTLGGNLASFFVLLAKYEDAFQEYVFRGFSREEATSYLSCYFRGLGTLLPSTGKIGLTKVYFNWISLYAFVSIFHVGGFNFQFAVVPASQFVLRNRESGQICVLPHDIRIKKDGFPLGYGGNSDEAESDLTSFEETENAYFGFPAEEMSFAREKRRFPKNEWEVDIKPGDEIFALHIPKGASIAPEALLEAVNKAKSLARERFPERKIKGVRCTSWLLNPYLETLLAEGSRIVSFGKLFARYPVKDSGESIYSFVFSGKPKDLRDLPEDTSLRKKAKEFLLAGNVLTDYGGYLREDK